MSTDAGTAPPPSLPSDDDDIVSQASQDVAAAQRQRTFGTDTCELTDFCVARRAARHERNARVLARRLALCRARLDAEVRVSDAYHEACEARDAAAATMHERQRELRAVQASYDAAQARYNAARATAAGVWRASDSPLVPRVMALERRLKRQHGERDDWLVHFYEGFADQAAEACAAEETGPFPLVYAIGRASRVRVDVAYDRVRYYGPRPEFTGNALNVEFRLVDSDSLASSSSDDDDDDDDDDTSDDDPADDASVDDPADA